MSTKPKAMIRLGKGRNHQRQWHQRLYISVEVPASIGHPRQANKHALFYPRPMVQDHYTGLYCWGGKMYSCLTVYHLCTKGGKKSKQPIDHGLSCDGRSRKARLLSWKRHKEPHKKELVGQSQRDGKNKINIAHDHCLSSEHSTQMWKKESS
jgi:hypothetical protein